MLYGQNIIVVYGSAAAPTQLNLHAATPAFLQSTADNTQEALKNTAIDVAKGKAIAAVAMKTIPVLGPVAGAIPVIGAFGKLE